MMHLTYLRQKAHEMNAEIYALYLSARHPEVRWYVPLLLAVALVLADPGPVRGLGRRLVFPGALAVAMVAGRAPWDALGPPVTANATLPCPQKPWT